MLLTISLPPSKNEPPWCFNSVGGGSVSYTATNCIALFLKRVLNGQSFRFLFVERFRNMRAMSHWSYFFFPHSSGVNIEEPVLYFKIPQVLAVFQVELGSFQSPTSRLDSKFVNSSLVEVMISSKSELVMIHGLSDTSLQMIFDGWLASMNLGSKCSIGRNDSRHGPSWHFYLHSGIEKTGSPGIICIYDQVLPHPSEHGTSSMGKHLLATVHITMLNKLTELDVTDFTSSTLNETVLAILQRQGSGGMTIVSLQRMIIFDI